MRKQRMVANPLQLIAGKQPLGHDADNQVLPLLVHLDEIRTGYGRNESIRIVTIYLKAMLSCVNNTDTKRNDTLIRYMAEAGRAWLASGENCMNKGIHDRVTLTGNDWQIISRAVRMFLMVMPQVPLYIWSGAITHARDIWDNAANLSSPQH